MAKSSFRVAVVLLALGVLVSVPQSAYAQAQESAPELYDDSGVWVYATYLKAPWGRVDSLLALNSIAPAWREKAKELGCFLDWRMMVHHTGTEYNVVYVTTYDSWADLTPGRGCGARAMREVMPDSTARAARNDGLEWVFGDYKHYDIIYWEPYSTSK